LTRLPKTIEKHAKRLCVLSHASASDWNLPLPRSTFRRILNVFSFLPVQFSRCGFGCPTA
jgi:hypothetical protein